MVDVTIYILIAAICNINAVNIIEVNGMETLMAQENEEVTIECKADADMAYCSYKHPSGKQFSVPKTSLEDGYCGYSFKITAADSGQWECLGSAGNNNTRIINVRVLSQLSAIQRRVRTAHGKEVTLSCKTVDRAPLKYCQFEPPAGKSFSIDSDATPEKELSKNALLATISWPQAKLAIVSAFKLGYHWSPCYPRYKALVTKGCNVDRDGLTDGLDLRYVSLSAIFNRGQQPTHYRLQTAIRERYYFPSSKKLSRGDCAVSISKVENEDEGKWTCGAQLDNGMEHRDTIVLQLKGVDTQPEETAYALGAIAAVALIAILGFILVRRLGVRTPSITGGQSPPTPRRPIPTIIIEPPSPSNSSRQ